MGQGGTRMKEHKPLFWWSFLLYSPTVMIGGQKYARVRLPVEMKQRRIAKLSRVKAWLQLRAGIAKVLGKYSRETVRYSYPPPV